MPGPLMVVVVPGPKVIVSPVLQTPMIRVLLAAMLTVELLPKVTLLVKVTLLPAADISMPELPLAAPKVSVEPEVKPMVVAPAVEAKTN